MPDDVARARRRLVVALLLVVLVAGSLAGAYYVLDGRALVADLLAGRLPWDVPQPSGGSTGTVDATATVDPLVGLPDEFVRRMWAEQVESQANIEKLINGEVTALVLNVVAVNGDLANLNVTAEFEDGTSADGMLVFTKYDGDWFVLAAQGMREPGTGGMAASVSESGSVVETPLPPMSEVDRAVVGTIVAEQRESQATIGEYLSGRVRRVDVLDVLDGPGTKTLKVRMIEDHEVAEADVVCIRKEQGDETLWFIARFEKTGSTPK
jgi:hypothetical protein